MDLGMDLESSLLWIPMPLKLVAMPPLCIKRLPAFTSRDPPLDKTTQVVTSIPVILMRDEFQPRMYNPQFICRVCKAVIAPTTHATSIVITHSYHLIIE